MLATLASQPSIGTAVDSPPGNPPGYAQCQFCSGGGVWWLASRSHPTNPSTLATLASQPSGTRRGFAARQSTWIRTTANFASEAGFGGLLREATLRIRPRWLRWRRNRRGPAVDSPPGNPPGCLD
nr:hypothetical protein [Methylomarinum sp. Ch1-1]MDP4519752.1 hypothetical protein [Methylomarinum sp. Ch1-1]